MIIRHKGLRNCKHSFAGIYSVTIYRRNISIPLFLRSGIIVFILILLIRKVHNSSILHFISKKQRCIIINSLIEGMGLEKNTDILQIFIILHVGIQCIQHYHLGIVAGSRDVRIHHTTTEGCIFHRGNGLVIALDISNLPWITGFSADFIILLEDKADTLLNIVRNGI